MLLSSCVRGILVISTHDLDQCSFRPGYIVAAGFRLSSQLFVLICSIALFCPFSSVAQINDAIQHVSSSGSDTNDGLSWSSAKLTVGAACTALGSNSSCTTGNKGIVYIAPSFTGAIPWNPNMNAGPTFFYLGGKEGSFVGNHEIDLLGSTRVWDYYGNFELAASASAASSGPPVTSAQMWFSGRYWTGSGSAEDAWLFQQATASGTNGASTINLLHQFGSAGPSYFNLGYPAAAPFNATDTLNWNSPGLQLTGNYWTGSVSAQDVWTTQTVLGSGPNPSSTLMVSHSGSLGPAVFSIQGIMQLQKGAFASLPACAPALEGSVAGVTDSSTSVWGAPILEDGSNHVLAYCDGTNWTVAGK